MTKYRHRLNRWRRVFQTLQGLPVLFVNNIGAVTQRLRGVIIGDTAEALPDTGSEPDLLSLDHVVRRGMHDLINKNDFRMIQFADGTVRKTMGSVWMNWAYANSSIDDDEWPEGFAQFHVLRGRAYDAIIGQGVLGQTDAFVTHTGSSMDVETDSSRRGSIWLPGFGRMTMEKRNQARGQRPGRWPEDVWTNTSAFAIDGAIARKGLRV